MICAQFAAGGCDGNVRLCELYWWRPEIAVRVPMCRAHGVAFVKGQEPFKGWTFRERLAWVRAKRWPNPSGVPRRCNARRLTHDAPMWQR